MVFLRVSIPARLRQSAWRGSRVSAKVRAEQDLREADVAADAVDAIDAQLSPGDLEQSNSADARDPVRGNAARARIGAQHDVRQSHACAVGPYVVGGPGRPVHLPPGQRSQFRRPDDTVSSR